MEKFDIQASKNLAKRQRIGKIFLGIIILSTLIGLVMLAVLIIDIAVEDARFSTLVTALTEAGLVDALLAEGPFTVFAPTDEAFAALPEGTIDALLADPGGQLTQILLYHVASGEVLSEDVTSGMEVATLQGDSASLEIRGDAILINGANVSDPDLAASNGVAHGIDAVLIPPSFGQ